MMCYYLNVHLQGQRVKLWDAVVVPKCFLWSYFQVMVKNPPSNEIQWHICTLNISFSSHSSNIPCTDGLKGNNERRNFFSWLKSITGIHLILYSEIIWLVRSRGAFSISRILFSPIDLYRTQWLITYFTNVSALPPGHRLSIVSYGRGRTSDTDTDGRGWQSRKGVTHHKTHHHIF